MNGPSRRRKRRLVAVGDAGEAFRTAVATPFRPVHVAIGEATRVRGT